MIEALIAIVGGTFAVLCSRIVLAKHKLGFHEYLSVAFVFISLLMLPLLPFMHNFSSSMLLPKYVWAMIGILITAFAYNLLYFKAFAHEKLSEIETFVLLTPLFAAGFAYLCFPAERALVPLVMAALATLALVWSHLNHGHLQFSKGSVLMFFAVVLFGLEYVFMKILLEVYNPYTLYFVRCLILSVIFTLKFGSRFSAVKAKTWKYLIATQVGYIVQFVAIFWSVEKKGIVLTNLMLNLIPVFVFAYAYFKYRDHPGWKKIAAGIIILACIIVAQLYH
jgi:hypothetical protein